VAGVSKLNLGRLVKVLRGLGVFLLPARGQKETLRQLYRLLPRSILAVPLLEYAAAVV